MNALQVRDIASDVEQFLTAGARAMFQRKLTTTRDRHQIYNDGEPTIRTFECLYLGKMVDPMMPPTRMREIQRFAALINRAYDVGVIGCVAASPGTVLGILACMEIPLASYRVMLVLYAASEFTMDEANKKLGNVAFIEEKGTPNDDWTITP